MKRISWFVGLILLCLGRPSFATNSDADFIAARQAYGAGNHTKLNAAAARLQSYSLYPYVAYWQLESRLKDASASEVHEFMDTYADSAVSDHLRSGWLKVLGKSQQWDSFLAEYPSLVYGDTETTCYALRARVAKNDDNALAEAKPLWFTGRDMPEACGPLFEKLLTENLLSAEDVWTRIRLALEAGNVSLAKVIYGHLKQSFNSRAFDTASDNPRRFLDLNKSNLKSRLTRELSIFALYRLAKNQLPQAFESWNEIRGEFSENEQHYGWGQMALQAARKHDPATLSWFRLAGNNALNDEQLGWKARAALRSGDWNDVLASIQSMSESAQQEGGWRYWKARAFKAQGKTAQANTILAPLSLERNFYGQLANEELGAAIGGLPASYKPSADEIKAIGSLPAIQRALKLRELNLRFEAIKEWNWAIRNYEDRHLLAAAELAQRNEWYERAISTADKTVHLHDFDLRYPSPYRNLMTNYTRQWELDEAWVYGLIRQESRFVVQAKSGVGASGLMQVMPNTAKWIAKRLGLKDRHQVLNDKMDQNIEFGTYYMRYVLNKLDGQPVLATAAYNAGPIRANRWRDLKSLEGAVYTESIPFSETRDYVKKVMSNAMYYAARFGQKILPLKDRLGTITGTSDSKQDCNAEDERSPGCAE